MCKKVMDHNEYPKSLKSKSTASLYFIMGDAREAAELGGENEGYYLDEVHYCAMEIKRRQEAKK